MAPVTIWGSDTTRSDLIKASCAELGVPFEFMALDWNAKEHKSEAFLKASAAIRGTQCEKCRAWLTHGWCSARTRRCADQPVRPDASLQGRQPDAGARLIQARRSAFNGARMTLDTRHAPRALSPRQTESGAIMLYLADKFGGAGPLGCDTPEKRAVLARWVRPVEARS